jgi:hypothetical protein
MIKKLATFSITANLLLGAFNVYAAAHLGNIDGQHHESSLNAQLEGRAVVPNEGRVNDDELSAQPIQSHNGLTTRWKKNLAWHSRGMLFELYELGRVFSIKLLSKTPLYDLAVAKEKARGFFTDDMDERDRVNIVTALAYYIPLNDRDDFETYVKGFMTQDMRGWDRSRTLAILAYYISPHDRKSFQTYRQGFITEDMDGSELSNITCDLAKCILPEDRLTFETYVQHFFTEDMSGAARVNLIRSLAKHISPQDRGAFERYVTRFLTPDMSEHDRASAVEALSVISVDDREAFEHYIKRFFASLYRMPLIADRIKILGELSRISTTDRVAFDKYVHRFASGVDVYNILRVVQSLSNIYPKDRAAFDAFAHRFLIDDMSSLNKGNIIEALSRIRKNDRTSFEKNIGRFLTEDMNNQDRFSVIVAVQQLAYYGGRGKADASEWDTVEAYIRLFLTEDMNGHHKATIICAVPPVKDFRAAFEARTRILIGNEMTGDGRVRVIKALSGIHHNEAEQYLHRLRNHGIDLPLTELTPRIIQILETPLLQQIPQENADLAEIIAIQDGYEYGMSVHQGERDRYTEATYKSLLKFQCDLDDKAIEESFSEFMNTLENQAQSDKISKIRQTLGLENALEQGFGGLLNNAYGITSLGLNGMKGDELIGRLWHFASTYTGNEGLSENQREKERKNAQASIFSALSNCVESDGHVVCDPGKLQRLAVSVLQGRLPGVNIDAERAQLTATETTEIIHMLWKEYQNNNPELPVTAEVLDNLEVRVRDLHPNANEPAFQAVLNYLNDTYIH